MPTQQTSLNTPPDERFWVRYSPHHEFRLSTLGSVLLHLLLYGTVAFLISTALLANNKTGPVKMDVVKGPGGTSGGANQGSGNPVVRQGHAEQGGRAVAPGAIGSSAPHDMRVPQPRIHEPKIEVPNAGYVPNTNGHEIGQFEAINKQLRIQGSRALPGDAADEPGEGGSGDPGGSGDNKPTTREQRMLRRVIKYDVGDGSLYRQELAGLGIIIATPEEDARGNTVYRVYRDLNHLPAKGTIENPAALRRTWWADENSKTVGLLARALQIRTPRAFYAFLPTKLEKDMLKKELAFKHLTNEKQIKKTVFAIVPIRNGYKVVVQSQELYGK